MNSSAKNSFDIIVLGGGPAGLGSALNLSKKGLSVLLIEKNKLTQTRKTWLTFDHIIDRYGLESCVRNRFSKVVFSSYLGGEYAFSDRNFILPIHEESALGRLADTSLEAGAVLQDEEVFLNFSPATNSVQVKTTRGNYSARALIDAMGRESPLLKSRGLDNDSIDMGCLAFMLEGINHNNDNALILYDSYLPGSDYFWLVPLDDGKLAAGIFFFSSLSKINMGEKIERLNLYLKGRNIRGKRYATRFGNIPLGGQRHLSTGLVFSLGDACNAALPSSGFSFNRCLEDSELMADFMQRFLKGETAAKDYKKEMLAGKVPGIEVHLIISDMLSKFTDPMLDKAIRGMKNLDEEFIISFLTGRDMSLQFSAQALRAILNTFSLSEIRNLSLKQNYFKIIDNLYNLIPSLSSAKIGEQIIKFAKSFL